MSEELGNLDLIDILGERHLQLQKISENLWSENNDVNLSNSEWLIMARIYKKNPSIAYVAKNVDISRQATHKLIKKLAAKGLVEVSDAEHNKKEKSIQLTDLGEEYFEKNEALKSDMEVKIAKTIGYEQLKSLKEMLKKDWGF